MNITQTLLELPVGGTKYFRNLSAGEVASIATTASRLNSDFKRRMKDGIDTTFVFDRKPDKARRCYHGVVTRYESALKKKNNRFVLPINPIIAERLTAAGE